MPAALEGDLGFVRRLGGLRWQSTSTSTRAGGSQGAPRRRADLLGIGWLVLIALLYLSPALKDGASFGPTDLGQSLSTLTSSAVTAPVHDVINGDVITLAVPWNTLDWQLVHHGELPLWNSSSGTGLPLLLNFESAPLALPTLVGYLVPLSESFLVTVLVKLLLAGTGAYVLSRVLGTKPLAAALAGTTFMLSGSFSGWLGWAISGPLAWSGWILAAMVLAYRSRRRVREIGLLAISVAFSIFGGFPESDVLLAGGLALVLVVAAIGHLLERRSLEWRGLARIGLGIVCGAALSAPLWLPGLSELGLSARSGRLSAVGLPPRALLLTFAQGFDGLPIHGSTFFGPADYFETAAYVGVLALVLAGTAALALWRRAIVAGLVVASLGCVLLVYRLGNHLAPVQELVRRVGLGSLAVQRALPVLALFVAVLAGLGCERVCKQWRDAQVRRAFVAATGACALPVVFLWTRIEQSSLPVEDRQLRVASLLWPTATIAFLVLVAVGLVLARAGRVPWPRNGASVLGLVLLGAQSSFLLFAGVGINSYASAPFPSTAELAQLRRAVGTGLLGLDGGNSDVRAWSGVGLYPNINLGYGLDELAIHDPTVPKAYFTTWPVAGAGQDAGRLLLFVPDLTTAALARRYGVADVLVGPQRPPPAGMTFLERIGSLRLYVVPGAARFSFLGRSGADAVTAVTKTSDRSWRLRVEAPSRGELELRLTDVPGWQVRVDGRATAATRVAGIFLEVALPAGSRTVTVTYWPARLSLAIALMALALGALVLSAVATAASTWRRAAIGARRGAATARSGAPERADRDALG